MMNILANIIQLSHLESMKHIKLARKCNLFLNKLHEEIWFPDVIVHPIMKMQ